MISQQLKKTKLPNSPGVYIFKKGKKSIYIGKATSLRDRVRSYFGKDLIGARGPILVDMVFQANKIDFIKTDSVLEALLLEAELIKKYQPKYNTKEKSDKSFLSVIISKEQLPRVFTIRTRNLKEHYNIFKNVKISKIYGPFTNGTQLREAMKIIRRIFPYLDDKSKNHYMFYKQVNLVPDVSNKEGIKQYKNNIKNLKLFFEGKKKKIISNLKKEMMQFAKKREFEKADEIKKRIFALTHINDVALIRGDNAKISNFRAFALGDKRQGTHDASNYLFSLKDFRIEAYDIAHMAGKNMVGVMVVIENGEINKSEYKRFKINTQTGSNDTGALEEVLLRRFRHTEWGLPNLVVIDGGVAQINVAKKTLTSYKYKIPIVSVVKDDKHKAKAIIGDENIIKIYKKDILLANTEAHRFAINYHKSIRSRNFIPTSLKLRRTRK